MSMAFFLKSNFLNYFSSYLSFLSYSQIFNFIFRIICFQMILFYDFRAYFCFTLAFSFRSIYTGQNITNVLFAYF